MLPPPPLQLRHAFMHAFYSICILLSVQLAGVYPRQKNYERQRQPESREAAKGVERQQRARLPKAKVLNAGKACSQRQQSRDKSLHVTSFACMLHDRVLTFSA